MRGFTRMLHDFQSVRAFNSKVNNRYHTPRFPAALYPVDSIAGLEKPPRNGTVIVVGGTILTFGVYGNRSQSDIGRDDHPVARIIEVVGLPGAAMRLIQLQSVKVETR